MSIGHARRESGYLPARATLLTFRLRGWGASALRITGAIYGVQQQFAALAFSWHPIDWLRFILQFQYMAAVHIQYMEVNKLNSGGSNRRKTDHDDEQA